MALFFLAWTLFFGDRCATIVPLDDQQEEKKCKWNTLEVGFPVQQPGMSANELLAGCRYTAIPYIILEGKEKNVKKVKLDLLI